MRKILVLLFLLLTGCATMQEPQKPTWYMSSEAKIKYYQDQIERYQYLISQERKKLEQD